MKKDRLGCGWILGITVLIFFASVYIIGNVLVRMGYSSVEGSYHLLTHSLLISVIITLLTCTKIIVDKLDELIEKMDKH